MHVVVCFVFLSPHFALATGFRFIVMPLLHECHCMFCFPLPPFEFANGFRFTAIPLLHELHCLFWDTSTIYLKHCGIYAFDASKKHSLPIWPRFSISLRSWDTGSATPCEDDHVTKKIRPNPSN